MKYLITFILLAFCINTNAQSFKDILNRKKNEIVQKAKNKVENKIDNKIDNTIDKGLNGIDDAVSGKKSKKKRNSENNDTEASGNTSSEMPDYNDDAAVSSNEIVISTNIKCQKGKELIEELIRDKRNVMSVSVDSGTGKVYVSISNDDDELKENILKLISENGFSANGKQPKTKTNVCK